MNLANSSPWLLSAAVVALGLFATPIQAQITPDTTLPNNSVVLPDGNVLTIEGGTEAGSNLFHSFSDFSIPTGSEAFFNNALTIDNIITRVTGGNLSNIDGLIRANGGANLFLINPNGIQFGPNASLDIGGSFLGSTADSLLFEDGSFFSATEPNTPPLLTLNVPIGLQFGVNPSPIEVREANLAVPTQETLSLTGGEILLTGEITLDDAEEISFSTGSLTAEQGRVELGSVAAPGLATLASTGDGFTLGYEDIDNFGEIRLTEFGIDVSGEGAGNLYLQGRQINILDDSSLTANTLGAQDGGSIILQASEAVEFFDTDTTDNAMTNGVDALVVEGATGRGADVTIETQLLRIANEAEIFLNTSSTTDTGEITIEATNLIMSEGAGIFIFIEPDATGNGGNIDIDVEQLELRDASQIGSGIFGAGDGSDITVNATSIEASGESEDGAFTSLITSVVIPGGTGNAGNISVETETLRLRDGAQIFTGTFGEGNAGNIEVRANSIELIGESSIEGFDSAISANASQATPDVTLNAGEGELGGAGGNIRVETETLQLSDGGQISASTNGPSDAGNLNVRATTIEVLGTSRLSTLAASDATGNGGQIQLDVERLSVRDGGEILAETRGAGNAGNIDVVGTLVEVRGVSADGETVSSINASSQSDGAAGSISISTDALNVSDRGEITVSSTGLGNAGNFNVTADNIRLNNGGSLQANVAAGSQGNMNLTSDFLLLRNNSNISTNATGTATGGNITIDTVNLVALENSDISANADRSFGGQVNIAAEGIFGTQFRDAPTPESDITATSALGVEFSGAVQIQTPDVDAASGLVALDGNTLNPDTQVSDSCIAAVENPFVFAGSGGLPEDPTDFFRGQTVWRDTRLGEIQSHLTPNPTEGESETSSIPTAPLVEATGWRWNDLGHIELVAASPSPSHSSWQPHPECNTTTQATSHPALPEEK